MTIKLTDKHKVKIVNSNDIFNVIQDILKMEDKIDQEREHLWIMSLTASNRVQNLELVGFGSVKRTAVEPMNAFRLAVMKGASKVVMIHNHPSQELQPSEADKKMTDRFIQVGRILDIEVVDHLIITLHSYLSFADIGLMKELEQSISWVPPFELIERIKAEEKKIRQEAVKMAKLQGEKTGIKKGKEEGIKKGVDMGMFEKALSMAHRMKEDNEPIEKIIRYTGLTREEIEKIN